MRLPLFVLRNRLRLERQADHELDLACTAYCAGSGSNCRRHSAAHGLGNATEVGTAQVANRVGEVGVVEHVEEIRAEGELAAFTPQAEGLLHGEVIVRQARAVVLVATGGADPASRRGGATGEGTGRGARTAEAGYIQRIIRVGEVGGNRAGQSYR